MAAADGGTATEIRVRARDWLDDWLVARTLEHRLADLDERRLQVVYRQLQSRERLAQVRHDLAKIVATLFPR